MSWAATSFHCPGVPRTQGSKTLGRTKGGKAYMRESSGGLAAWRTAVALAARVAHRGPVVDGPVSVGLQFRFARPKKPGAAYPRGDIDKLTRAILDAITGIVIKDDNAVVSVAARKGWSDEPSVSVIVMLEEI